MNEFTKTLFFVGAALAVVLLAVVLRPEPFEQTRQRTGEKLFGELEDAASASALQIVSFDKDSSKPVRLEVERNGDQWVIASHNDYPADASGSKDRIQDMAIKLMDLEVLGVASELTDDHGLFGVVEPPKPGGVQEADDEDIGILVGLQDDRGNALAKLVIGKQVRDEQSDEVKRFVRKVGEPTVYTAAIDTDQINSDFADWIEPDLLGINSADIRRVTIKDYNAELVDVQGLGGGQQVTAIDPRFDLTVDWDDDESKWQFVSMKERRQNRVVPTELTEDEELNSAKLDDLKRAVASLKIIDVDSKPAALIDEVKSDADLVRDPALRQVMQEKGFFPARGELLASSGEFRVQTEEGIEYILRFGSEAGVEQDEENKSKLTRYLLVSAQLAQEQFVKNDSDTQPPITPDNPLGPPLGAGGQAGEEGEAAEAATEADEDSEEKPEDAEAGAAERTDDTGETSGEEEQPADDDAPSEDDDQPLPPDTVPPNAAPIDQPPAEVDELAQKRKAAEEKVAELNQKFANWWYVISEDEYKKIRLGRFDVIQEKGESSFGLDELKDLDGPSSNPGTGLPDLNDPTGTP